eukprot:jgi/Botrbrau1/12018/Bobra.247_2s0022.2
MLVVPLRLSPVGPGNMKVLSSTSKSKSHQVTERIPCGFARRLVSGSQCSSSRPSEHMKETVLVDQCSRTRGPGEFWNLGSKVTSSILASAFWLCVSVQPSAAYMDFSTSVITVVSGVHTVLMDQNASAEREGSRQVFFDVRVDNEQKGRITIQLYPDVPIGAERFLELAEGRDGVSYRLSKIDGIAETYIKSSGVKSLSYAADKATPIAGGDTVEQLEVELDECRHRHDDAGIVSLIVRDSRDRDVKERLVAYQGKLVKVQDAVGEVPNGTGFAITTAASPDLDATNLVVGRVVEGMDLVAQIASLPAVKANTNSAFFQAAKIAGDKRALVAEKGFGRPFSKIVISKSGSVAPVARLQA